MSDHPQSDKRQQTIDNNQFYSDSVVGIIDDELVQKVGYHRCQKSYGENPTFSVDLVFGKNSEGEKSQKRSVSVAGNFHNQIYNRLVVDSFENHNQNEENHCKSEVNPHS